MERPEEITPEYVTATIDKCVDNMGKLVQYTREQFTSIFNQMVHVGRGLDDLCIEAGIGSHSSEMLSTFGDSMEDMMKMLMCNYASHFGRELDYLSSQSAVTVNLGRDVAPRMNDAAIPIVADTWKFLPTTIEECKKYRLEEKKEIVERFNGHVKAFKEWKENAENKNRIDDASIVTALQNLDLQYEQNVEELELTSEYVADTINKAVRDMEKISDLTKRHYTSMANLHHQFSMEYDDLCIDAGLPSHAREIYADVQEALSVQMRSALYQCAAYFGHEVDYLQSRCGQPVHLKKEFMSTIEHLLMPTLDQTWNPVLAKIAKHFRYKKEEQDKVLSKCKRHQEIFEEWKEQLKEKTEKAVAMNEADQTWINNTIQEERKGEKISGTVKECHERLKIFRDKVGEWAQNVLIVYNDACKELIDICTEMKIYDSSKLVEHLMKGQMEVLNAFERCAFGLLEKNRLRNVVQQNASQFALIRKEERDKGSVFKVELPGTFFGKVETVTVAYKKFENSDVARGTNEILTLSRLDHRNVVRFMGRGIEGDERYVLMEYCSRSLACEIIECRKNESFLEQSNFVKWGAELIAALRFLQSNGIVHCDLKPNNILIGKENEIKLADFGISPPIHTYSMELIVKEQFLKGTLRYMAPELHNGEELDGVDRIKCDVWSFGICLWEMMTCHTPYGNLTDPALPHHIGKRCWNSNLDDRPPMSLVAEQFQLVEKEINEELYYGLQKEDPEGYWRNECTRWIEAGRE
ncbi:hypothetical protein PRIPAC_77611 [Pristionchus pacificus]|uniref:Protein kinase domain-containing protein n=1 Tax=Pristionchus pacificus TaxID=54126 RepID=A0A2A6BXL2_PRIPA|nr:hypothetical protein PRIPAC_77611 [Pristionchus pacificus]|eukprot:PDM70619.1 protein kinase [Pristionchus pacificus]